MENLAGKAAKTILDYFANTHVPRAAIVKFENFSDLSDLGAQKYYQLLVAGLEADSQLDFTDLMINFHQRRGEFNLNRLDRLNYLVYLKLIRNRGKLGAGVVIFSRNLDKIVYIKYLEAPFPAVEKDLYEILDYGFKGTGFSLLMELAASEHLLDVQRVPAEGGAAPSPITAPSDVSDPEDSMEPVDAEKAPAAPPGELRYLFFYPDRIELMTVQRNHLKRAASIGLEWGRPYYPVMEPEGRLTFFQVEGRLHFTVGGNFSQQSKIFTLVSGDPLEVRESGTVDFVPLHMLRLNGLDYLVGGRYDEGKNYFKGGLVAAPFDAGRLQRESRLEKQLPPFYSAAFGVPPHRELETIHLVDTDYNYRIYSADFEERTAAAEKRGSALGILDGRWLAAADYATGGDTLFFYKIEEGSSRLVYENRLDGEVMFISPGVWKDRSGFWVYMKKNLTETTGKRDAYTLQFWSENNG